MHRAVVREQGSPRATVFVTLHQQLRTGVGRDDILDRLVHLAVASVPGCDWAGLMSWPVNDLPHSVMETGELVGEVDDLQ